MALEEEDRKYYNDRINLVSTDGWLSLVEELEQVEERTDKLDSIENEKDLWFARGQLSILRQILSLEEATKRAMVELDV